MTRTDRTGAALGALGVAGNVLGVAFLADVPGAYRPASLDAWLAGSLAHPGATAASAVAFTVGLLALAGWAVALGRATRRPIARAGAAAVAAGALINAAGCVAPLVLVLHVSPACAGPACDTAGRALLGLTLSLDALFNLLLGAGLLAMAAALVRDGRRALGGLGLLAGLATLPVGGQVAWEWAAKLLVVAGPLWLAFVIATSASLWRGRVRPAAPAVRPVGERGDAWAR